TIANAHRRMENEGNLETLHSSDKNDRAGENAPAPLPAARVSKKCHAVLAQMVPSGEGRLKSIFEVFSRAGAKPPHEKTPLLSIPSLRSSFQPRVFQHPPRCII
ncbi:MAG: hypothetical protein DRI61_01855, partial [Chloroflexi bacterium]